MREDNRAEWFARVALTVAALLPYWPLLTFSTLLVTDDGFASDIWNGELPGRIVAAGRDAASGGPASWTNLLCSGTPLQGGAEPLSGLAFGILPPAPALDLLLLIWLLVAAHGTYALARRYGASRPAAVLAGTAFAASGYVVTQLKHMSIIGTVVWLPYALLCLDRALGPAPPLQKAPPRLSLLALFGCIFGLQALQGFPQSAYICALLYGAYALFCVASRAPDESEASRKRARWLVPAALAALLGAVAAAPVLWPLWTLAQISDRGAGGSLTWAVSYAYEPRNVLTFLWPYAYGDASDMTYSGESVFWEDYGYVGLATCLLAIYASLRMRRSPRVLFWLGAGLIAYLMVLGPATPFFGAMHAIVPGFGLFRMPTRFLVIVDLALCLLAALGLTRLAQDLEPVLNRRGLQRLMPYFAHAVCAITALDLLVHQARQNAFVDAGEWLAAPRVVEVLRAEPPKPRIFSPFHRDMHRAAYGAARGWTDLHPFYALRGLLQPNSNVYWGIASADCYAGIGPRWQVDVWGDHSRASKLVYRTLRPSPTAMQIDASPQFATLMRAYGVTHVVSSMPMPALEPAIDRGGDAQGASDAMRVYRVEGSARVRVVPHARYAPNDEAAIEMLLDASFDPRTQVVLSDVVGRAAPELPPSDAPWTGSAMIERDADSLLVIRAKTSAPAHLVLADTFYPGWSARVDGRPTEVLRANLSVRALPLAAGTHRIELSYRAPGYGEARASSLAAFLVLSAALGSGALRRR